MIPHIQNITKLQSTATLSLILSRLLKQFLHLGKLLVILQAARIRQRSTRLDDLARNDLLHGQLNLFKVDRSLCSVSGYDLCES